ncbi:MAG: hypothetical protein ACRD04_01520, partial [Terriglobales bacterium]
GDAGRPDGVIADLRFDLCALRPALDHPISVLLPHRSFGEVAASSARDRPKEGFVFVLPLKQKTYRVVVSSV